MVENPGSPLDCKNVGTYMRTGFVWFVEKHLVAIFWMTDDIATLFSTRKAALSSRLLPVRLRHFVGLYRKAIHTN